MNLVLKGVVYFVGDSVELLFVNFLLRSMLLFFVCFIHVVLALIFVIKVKLEVTLLNEFLDEDGAMGGIEGIEAMKIVRLGEMDGMD